MSKAKENIFAALRQYTKQRPVEEIQQKAAALLSDNLDIRQRLFGETPIAAFKQRIIDGLLVGTTFEQLNSVTDIPQAIKVQLEAWQCQQEIAVQAHPDLQLLDWSGFKTDIDIELDGTAAVVMAEYGIAETSSLVVHSSEQMPILMNFLPLYQFMVVKRESILEYLEDYSAIAAAEDLAPRNTVLITGASGTTDIEGVLVQGAHGPKLLHIFIV